MTLIINVIFAWVTVVLVVLLSVVYLLRVVNKKYFNNKNQVLAKWNKKLRKPHKWLGLAAIVTAVIHGLFSSMALISGNKGTLTTVFLVLLGLSYMFRKALKKVKGYMFYHRILTVIVLVFTVLHLVEVGGIIGPQTFFTEVMAEFKTEEGKVEEVMSEPVSEDISFVTENETVEAEMLENTFVDGTYIGEATGFNDGLKVSVVIENQMIVAVEVIEHNEVNERFWGIPVETVPESIVKEQSPYVDTVSGATMTSTGIINAVVDALNQATVAEEIYEELDLPSGGHGHGKR